MNNEGEGTIMNELKEGGEGFKETAVWNQERSEELVNVAEDNQVVISLNQEDIDGGE